MKTRKRKGSGHRVRTAMLVLAGLLIVPVVLAAGLVTMLRFGTTDTQRAQWATRLLTGVTPGRIMIGSLDWDFPARVALRDVRVYPAQTDPRGAALLTAKKATADLLLPALLDHRVAITQVRVEDAEVTMTQADEAAPFDLAAAFAPQEKKSALEAPETRPWMVSIDKITLERVAFVLKAPDLRVAVHNTTVKDGAFWLRGDVMGITANLHGNVAVHAGETHIQSDDVAVRVEQGVWTTQGDDADIGVKDLRVQAQGNGLQASGHLQIVAGAPGEVDATANLQVDVAASLVQARLPTLLQKQLHGKSQIQVRLKGDAKSMDYKVDMQSQPDTASMVFGHTPLDSLHIEGHYAQPTLSIAQLKLKSDKATVEVDGKIALMLQQKVVLGQHTLHVKASDVPLAHALAPFVAGSDMMPGHVDLQLGCSGTALWPPRSDATLQMSVRDIPKKLIGVPDPMRISGKFQGQGTKIHIEQFRLEGDGTDFAVQGDIPLKPEGVMDVLGELKQLKTGKTLKRFKVPLGVREVRLRTRLTGTFANPHAEGMLWAEDLRAQDHVMQLRVPYTFADGRLGLQHAVLSLDDGHADVSGELSFGQTPQMALKATLTKVAALASGLPLTGFIDGDISAHGPLGEPVAQGHITWREAGWEQSPARAEVSLVAQSDTRGMHVQAFDIAPAGGGSSHVHGDIHWDTREIDIAWEAAGITTQWLARAAGAAPELEARGALRAQGHVRGPFADTRGEARITLEQAGVAQAEPGGCGHRHPKQSRAGDGHGGLGPAS